MTKAVRNQRGRAAPVSMSTPMAMTTEKPEMPSSGLGMPKAAACSLIITEPQVKDSPNVQDGT